MKRLLALLLCIAVLLSLSACGSKYPPVKSTAEESKTVITLSYGGRNYKVKYELYRAFFLTYHEEVDGGDLSVYAGEDGAEYRANINAMILKQVADIYAVEALCREIDFDQYSKDADQTVEDYITLCIEGGATEGGEVDGLGSYEAYLASLKEQYIIYSVQDLIYRYYIGESALEDHYLGVDGEFVSEFSFGATTYTETDLRAFYDGNTTVRVLWCYLPSNVYDQTKLDTTRGKLLDAIEKGTSDADRENRVGVAMINATTTAADEVLAGQLITRDSLDENLYGEITDKAFSLNVGELSEAIPVESDLYHGYFIVYKTVKTDAYFTAHKDDVKTAFLLDALGKKIHEVRDEMIGSAEFTKDVLSLDFASVKMD